ncbi:MAG: NAD(P)H-dependent oxidoreductase subunit E [Spirochaetia bacterium]
MAGTDKKILVKVCMGTNCAFRGASSVLDALRGEEDIQDNIVIEEVSCIDDKCDRSKNSPVVEIDGKAYLKSKPEIILDEIYRIIENS